jgi:hypothetical protein
MADTVLAHLASTLSQKENLATEALAFIVNRSAAARTALAREVGRLLEETLPIARVETQTAFGDESRPDLILHREDGHVVGFIEAKFWASLTAAQPIEYLRRLAEGGGGALVMLAPERRLPSLRAEVMERCSVASIGVEPSGLWTLRGGGHRIAFLSWTRLLTALADATVEDVAASSDVRQLRGLCARFETEGFIPLTREDIDDLDVPRRVLALANLVNDIVEKAVAEGVLNTKALRPAHSIWYSGRYVAFDSAVCFLGLAHQQWSTRGRSPMWLRFKRDAWERADELRPILRPWASEDPPRAYIDDDDRSVRVPILLRVGVEKDAVVAHAVAQLREVDGLMRAAGMTPLKGAAPPPTEE